IPEGGFHSMPALAGNGWMICGDAAQMVNAVNGEGTNLAILSGRLAGETAILAHARGDYSLGMLEHYNEGIRASIIYKDLKKYSGIHGLLSGPERRVLFGKLPGVLNEAVSQYMSVDGTPKRDKQKQLIKQVRDAAGGNVELLRLGLKGWRAINR
ncbi:FAD-dependent oxidoreductase, partial [Alicyclobacillaceae bacterium I2511]